MGSEGDYQVGTEGEEKEMRDVIFDLAKYAMDNGKRITISISQFDDGGSCVSFTIFEPEEEEHGTDDAPGH